MLILPVTETIKLSQEFRLNAVCQTSLTLCVLEKACLVSKFDTQTHAHEEPNKELAEKN